MNGFGVCGAQDCEGIVSCRTHRGRDSRIQNRWHDERYEVKKTVRLHREAVGTDGGYSTGV